METVGFDKLVEKNADVDDTLKLIVFAVNDCYKRPFVAKIVSELRKISTDRDSFIRNLFDYYCRNVNYVLDKIGVEKVYTPERTIMEGAGDCKKAATFLASVLKCANIEPVLKHVYYNNNDEYTHIYVIVPNPDLKHYITLDPTNNKSYNSEVSYKSATLYFLNGKKMELRYMGKPSNDSPYGGIPFSEEIGTGCNTMMGEIEGISEDLMGFRDLSKFSHVKRGKDMNPLHQHKHTSFLHTAHRQKMAKLLPASKQHLLKLTQHIPIQDQRGSFLELLKHNVDGISTNFAAALGTNAHALDSVWKEMGGSAENLKKAALEGAKRAPISSDSEPVHVHGPEYIGKGFWKKLLHGAAVILHAIAPVVNAILPGAGNVLSRVADKAEFIATRVPEKGPDGKLQPPPALPSDPTGYKDPIPGMARQGSAMGSVGGFIFKTLLIISNFNLNPKLAGMLGLFAVSAPLLYIGYKKLTKKWKNLQHI